MSVQTPANATRPARRNWLDIAKGFGALGAVTALVVGVPYALIAWVGWPLPEEMTGIDQVADALRDRFIPDAFLIKALAVVCWLVWIELVASLIVEAVAYLRGRRAGRVPLAGGIQRAAARLVATIALLGALVGTKGLPDLVRQPLTPASSAAAVTLVSGAGESGPKERVAPASVPAPAPNLVYEVQRRDTLWDVAERHLGDPFRWVEIYELTRDRPQPDGRVLTDPDLIYVGWQLQLPPDAVGLAAPPAPAPEPAPPPAPTPGDGGTGDPQTPAPTGDDTAMVLIDDGTGGGPGSGVTVAQGGGAAAGGPAPPYDPDGMVLLPAEPAGGPPERHEGEVADANVAEPAPPGPGETDTIGATAHAHE